MAKRNNLRSPHDILTKWKKVSYNEMDAAGDRFSGEESLKHREYRHSLERWGFYTACRFAVRYPEETTRSAFVTLRLQEILDEN